MVGAGFSRSAASTGDINKKLPLWNSFSEKLSRELDSNSTDPLRLAEEYCAYFGKQTLYDLIKKEINDTAWLPGKLHKSLLELPWSEILTTNWDTLLERASAEVHQPIYSVVSKQEDLASARPPRIVKLHGTIDTTSDLVFTQEDYRKYPQQYAAFVNFARQVFIENELCLLGFSGDDPNFLQWIGWVRDHLATHSRRIYLVGALGLNSAKRKYLESINIAPIDLSDLVKDYDEQDIKHLKATTIFFQSLQYLKPKKTWEWCPTQQHNTTIAPEEITKTYKNHSYAAKLLESQIPALEKNRFLYPGWLIFPYEQRPQLKERIIDPCPTSDNLSAMTIDSKAKILYEISWNYQLTFDVIPSWLTKELLAVCDLEKPCVLSKKQQLEIATLLLKNTRWMNNTESKDIAKKTKAILEEGKRYWPESNNELAYHNAIIARDHFDYAALEQYIEGITSNSPVWKLKKASLLAELGQFNKGNDLIAESYKELQIQYRNDQNSIYIASRLAWAHWIMRSINLLSSNKDHKAFPSHYQETKCDPWDHISYIRIVSSKKLDAQKKKQTIKPRFKPGHYQDNTNTVTLSNEPHPLPLLEGMSNNTGMPLRWNNVNFLAEQTAEIAELKEINNLHRFSLAIRSASNDTSEVLEKVFSRVHVACLPEDDVTTLLNQCKSAICYWKEKRKEKSSDISAFALERLQVFIEVLARISVRTTPEQSISLFRFAISLGKESEFHHFWLFDALKDLLDFSLKSIPESQQNEILLDALSFPLFSEISSDSPIKWANPIIEHPGNRENNLILDRRIDEIIDNIAPCSKQSAPALERLIPLIKNNFIMDSEIEKISQKIWGSDFNLSKIPETGLLTYVLLELPSPDASAVKALIRRYLFEQESSNLINLELLSDIFNAASSEDTEEHPSEDQAINYFENLVDWRPSINENDTLNILKNNKRQTAKLIGEVLAVSIVPVLPSEALTEKNFQRLCDFYSEVEAPKALIAFPYFAIEHKNLVNKVELLIRQGLQSNNANKVAHASHAILTWRKNQNSPTTNRLILRLVYAVGANKITGLHALLWTANQMYCSNYLSRDNIDSLIEILPIIFDNADYRNFFQSGQEVVGISLVRTECIKLAKNICNKSDHKNDEISRIIEEAKLDPLPEVRFA